MIGRWQSSMLQASLTLAVIKTPNGPVHGEITMWTTNDATTGAFCEFAAKGVGLSHLPRHIRKGLQCAIGDEAGKGEHCGRCYKVTSKSDSGTAGTPGKMGSAEVMITDSGAGGSEHFDCVVDSFEDITGARTGIFDIEFEQTVCTGIEGNPVITNWADKNAWYCKMMFQNVAGWGGLDSVKACLDGGSECADLTLFSGATWIGCPKGEGSSMTFALTQKSPQGASETIDCECNVNGGKWPWPTNTQCTCGSQFSAGGGASPPTPPPSDGPDPTPSSSASPSPNGPDPTPSSSASPSQNGPDPTPSSSASPSPSVPDPAPSPSATSTPKGNDSLPLDASSLRATVTVWIWLNLAISILW